MNYSCSDIRDKMTVSYFETVFYELIINKLFRKVYNILLLTNIILKE